MILRWLVNTYLRQAAQQKVMEVVAGAARGAGQRPNAGAESGEDGSPPEPPPPCELAFVFGLGIESGGLVDLLQDAVTTRCPAFLEHAGSLNERRVVVVDAGVGTKCAARATADVISIHRPAWVISAGFAGALVDELKRGHFLLADSVANVHGKSLAIDLHLAPQTGSETPAWHVGRLLTVDRLIRKESQKRDLATAHEALACDMETLAVAEVCEREKTRFLAVRIVSDAVDDKLPKEAEGLLNQKSLAGKLGAFTGALMNRPSSVKDLWQLREDALRASDRLARVLAGVAEQLPSDVSAGG